MNALGEDPIKAIRTRIGDLMVRRSTSLVTLLGLILLTVAAVLVSLRLEFSYDIETFFSPDDPDLTYYKEYIQDYGSDNTLVMVGFESDSGIFRPGYLASVEQAIDSILQHPDVLRVTTPTRMKRYMSSPLGIPFELPLLDTGDPGRIAADSARIFREGVLLNSFFSADGKGMTILVEARSFISPDVHESMLTEIERIATRSGAGKPYFAGRIPIQNYYVKMVRRELVLFSLITFLLMAIFLRVLYKSLLGILFPLFIIVIATIWTLALIRITGGNIDLMLTMLPTILFVVSIADTVHILNKYIFETRQGRDRATAIRLTIKEIGLATFLTSFTTAVGFASLAFIPVPPLQRFGFYVAAGVLITFLVTILLLPALLLLVPGANDFGKHEDRVNWPDRMHRLYGFIIHRSKWVAAVSIVLILLFSSGTLRLQVNNHFLDDLVAKSSLKRDMAWFEEHFSGIRPIEIGMELRDSSMSLFDPEVLREMEQVEGFLAENYGAGFLWSPLNYVRLINQGLHNGNPDYYVIPPDPYRIGRILNSGKVRELSGTGQMHWSEDLDHARFTGRMSDVGSARVFVMNDAFEDYVASNTSLIDYRVTGSMQLIDNNNKHLSVSLLRGLGIALLVVSLLVLFMFRSPRIALVALIPNLVPLAVVAGFMGWFGIDLKVPTAMIFTIAFGIAVDDSIHLLSKIRVELSKGMAFNDALRSAFIHTGKSIILTSVILAAGFLTFMLSASRSTFTVGAMISVTLVVAVVADLFILPLLLRRRS